MGTASQKQWKGYGMNRAWKSFGREKKATSVVHETASDGGTVQSSQSADIASEDSNISDWNGGLTSSSFRLPLNKRNAALQAIGKDIKKLHKKIEIREKERLQQFVKVNQPKQKTRIAELKKLIERIKNQIESEREAGLTALEALNDKVVQFENEMNRIKSQMHFPSSKIVYGRDGIFVGYDDFWIDKIYGQLSLQMLPGSVNDRSDDSIQQCIPPRLLVTLTGNNLASEAVDDDWGASPAGDVGEQRRGDTGEDTISRHSSEGTPSKVNATAGTPTQHPRSRGAERSIDDNRYTKSAASSGILVGRRKSSIPTAGLMQQPSRTSGGSGAGVGPGDPACENEGIGVRIRLDKFNLKSDSSSLSIALDTLELSMVIKVQISLEFMPSATVKDTSFLGGSTAVKHGDNKLRRRTLSNVGVIRNQSYDSHDSSTPLPTTASASGDRCTSHEWVIPKKDGLVISVQSFKGPLGIGRNVMSALVSLVTPMVRTQDIIPREIGLILSGDSSGVFSGGGTFELRGTSIDSLNTKLFKCPDVLKGMNLTAEQLHIFRYLQKSINTPRLKTTTDLLQYMAKYSGEPDDGSWEVLKSHWNMALRAFHSGLKTCITDANSSLSAEAIPDLFSFEDLLQHAAALSRKPMHLQLQLTELAGRIPLKKCLCSYHLWLLRMLDNSVEINTGKGFLRNEEEMSSYVESNRIRLEAEHLERRMILQVLADCLYTTSIDIFLDAQSGSDITISVEEANTTMPLSVLSVCPLNPFCASIRPLVEFLMDVYSPTPTEQIHASLQGDDLLVKILSSAITGCPTTQSPDELTHGIIPTEKAVTAIGSDLNGAGQVPQSSSTGLSSLPQQQLLCIFSALIRRFSTGLVCSSAIPGELSACAGDTICSISVQSQSRDDDSGGVSQGGSAFGELTLSPLEVLTKCQATRPLICALVNFLPQHVQSQTRGMHIAQGVMSDVPVQLAMSTMFRLSVALESAFFTLDMPRCISFIDSYINNPSNMRDLGVDAEKTTAVRKILETAYRYLIGDGLDVFLAAKIFLESNSAENDVMLSLSTPSFATNTSTGGISQVGSGKAAASAATTTCSYSAVKISATAGLYDLMDDINSLMSIDISGPTTP